MKLAVRKEPGFISGRGAYYTLLTEKIETLDDEKGYAALGFIIIEVTDYAGERLLWQAKEAFGHQMQIAIFTEEALAKERK